MRPTIDILISNFNTSDLLTSGIIEPLAPHFGKDLNLIIVDDCSDPEDFNQLEANLTVPHTLIRHATNWGVTQTMSHLLALARAPFRFLGNSDLIISSIHDLHRMASILDSRPGPALVGTAEGPRFLLPDAKPYTLTPAPTDPRPLLQDYVSACALMFKLSPATADLSFDEHYAPGYYEDTHLSYILRARGFLTLYAPTAIHHLGNVAIIRHQTQHTRDDTHTPWHDLQERNRLQFLNSWSDCLSPRADTYAIARENWLHTQRYLTERNR